jgi:metal-responsive CopG/Arc/MetJ family transcriptional regulator
LRTVQVRDMPKEGYASVTIPEEVAADIDGIRRIGHGYRSRANVVKDAVRRLLIQLKKEEPGKV